uniref:Uncharacterized protein n=1 Tax=Balaenoptera musculus TaxID=9771 RepID=A0A8C0DE20_BALMU
ERSLKFSTSDNCTFSKTPSARFLKTSFSDCQTSPGWTSALIGSQRFLLGSAVTIKKRTVSELPHPLLDLSKERVPDKEAIHSQEAKGTVLTEKAGFFPPVENLDPRERRRSTEPPEDWPSEEEIRRFWKLRQEIVGSEPAEVPESQRLPVELPPALKAVLRDKEMRRPRPRPVFRTRTPSFKSVLPELVPRQQALGRTSLPEESRVLALRELREKQAQLEQCRRDKRALQEWRELAQRTKRRREGSATSRPHGGTWYIWGGQPVQPRGVARLPEPGSTGEGGLTARRPLSLSQQ